MVRNSVAIFMVMVVCTACSRMDKRDARYDTTACPICSHITNGACPYCNGTGKCMYCQGLKERTVVSPNFSEETIKPFSYKKPCPYCKGSGVCHYCNGSGKCWACGGTQKVSKDWECLNSKPQQAAADEK
ncbi:MAG: hypothetical protein JW913_07205 [Chitinispirillaceae bacterium]|nr:hypothetical protein [Chitinispirillaceae bacterium]